ncbi:T9SS type A sorting domain-containing protein [Limibacter armeniacum]|uniref:T9SS type A sorting domain-containing protein n=1 Tax=Limibacter armeniacum TaxID=466084 RepID=UPI002FE577A8
MRWLLSLFFVLSCIFSAEAQTQDTLQGPAVWYRSLEVNPSVKEWKDISGHNRHANILNASLTDSVKLVNYQPVRHFNGITEGFKVPFGLEGITGLSTMVVFAPADTLERGIWSTPTGAERDVMLTTGRVLGPDSLTDVFSYEVGVPVLNTVIQNWSENTDRSAATYLTFGSVADARQIPNYKGTLAELLIFDRILTPLEKAQYETYLALKYGITLSESNYVSSAEQLLWSLTENAGFSQNMAGIGRDDYFGLYQKQAVSTKETKSVLSVGVKQVVASNLANNSTIKDLSFLVWGDNGKELNTTISETNGMHTEMLDRKWLLQVAGEGSTLSTNLYFKKDQLSEPSEKYWLAMDPTGSGNFNIDDLVLIYPDENSKQDKAAQQELQFSNLYWDQDNSGKDGFTLLKQEYMLTQVKVKQSPLCLNPESGIISLNTVGGTGPFKYTLESQRLGFRKELKGSDSLFVDGLRSGDYQIKVRDNSGYELSRSFTLKMPDEIAIELGEDLVLEEGETFWLDAASGISDSLNLTYEWESSHGNYSTGSKIEVREPGVYRVTVTDERGCTCMDDLVISGSDTERVTVFPNLVTPAEAFSISVSLPEVTGVEVGIYDMSGKEREHFEGSGYAEYLFKAQIRQRGMYLVTLKTTEGKTSRKVIVR